MGGWSHGLRLPDPDISYRFLCDEIASESNPSGAQWFRYCNPEVDELLVAFQTEFDEEKRLDLLYQAQAIINQDAYFIYLFKAPEIYAINSKLQNFELTPFTRWYGNIHNWEFGE